MSVALSTPQPCIEPAAIWLRLPKEPGQAYAAFVVYRDLGCEGGKRSLRAVASRLGRGLRVLQEWSSRWNWVERADAYVGHLDALRVQAHEDDLIRERREHNDRLRAMGRNLQLVANAPRPRA